MMGRIPRLYEFRGEMLPIRVIAARLGLHVSTVYGRVSGNRVLDGQELADPHHEPRSSAIIVFIGGEALTVTDWAERYGISRETVYSRLANGWHPVRAITTPADPRFALRTIKLRNRRVIHRLVIGFRASLAPLPSQAVTHTGGYQTTFPLSSGTGVGSRARHLQAENAPTEANP